MDPVNLAAKFALIAEQWAPKIIGRVDDYDVKIVKLEGEFVWHQHADADELFLVVEGALTIELRDGPVELAAGELFVVPRGTEHRPVAHAECQVMLFERRGLVNTGDGAETERTRAPEEL